MEILLLLSQSSHPPPGDGWLNRRCIEKEKSVAPPFRFFKLLSASRPPEVDGYFEAAYGCNPASWKIQVPRNSESLKVL